MSQKRSKNSIKSEKDHKGSKKQKVRGEKRYRFKNFNERIEEIDISSIQNLGGYRGSGPQSTDSTWFELNLDAWKELNCSTAFAQFCYAVTPLTGTLPKLLFNQGRIVEEIFKVLRKVDEDGPESSSRLALIPVLSLTAMIAKDLGSEFLGYFPEFYRLLLPILPSSEDPETIEAAFASLLYVFRCLLDDLLDNLPGTFDLVVSPLLSLSISDSRGYLRRFGAECFGYLLRKKMKIKESGFFEAAEKCQKDSCSFIADCFVAAILDETGKFRICLKPLLLEIYSHIQETSSPFWISIFRFISVKLLDGTDLSTNVPLWKIFVQFLSEDDRHVPCLTKILIDSFAYRRGTRVQLHALLLPQLYKLDSIELYVYFLRSMNLEVTIQNRQAILKLVSSVIYVNNSIDLANLLSLCSGLAATNWIHYELILSDYVTLFVSQLVRVDDNVINLFEVIFSKYPNSPSSLSSVVKLLSHEIIHNKSIKSIRLLIEHFPSKFPVELICYFKEAFSTIMKAENGSFSREELYLYIQAVKILGTQYFSFDVEENVLLRFCKNLQYPEQLSAISLALSIMEMQISSITSSALVEISSNCLRSCSSEWRMESLNLLKVLLKDEELSIVEILEEIEDVSSDLENYREKLLKLKKLDHISLLNTKLESNADSTSTLNVSADLILNYLMGFVQIKMTLLWPEGFRIISKFSVKFPKEFSQLASNLLNDPIFMVEKDLNLTNISIENQSYDFEIDDEGLNSLDRIKKLIEFSQPSDDERVEKNECIPELYDSKLMISALFKLLANHPEACAEEFKENVLIPLIIKVFSNTNNKVDSDFSKLIQSNLSLILQCLSGISSLSLNLEEIFLKFLCNGDLQIQIRSLDCIFNIKKYGAALSNQWKSRLKSLLNDNLFREELTILTAEAENLFKVAHWHTLIAPLIIRILFGRFISRKGAGAGRQSLPLRRKMILNCFGTWDQSSLTLIADFLLTKSGKSNEDSTQQLGFLNLLHDVFASLGRKMDSESMDRLICRLIQIGVNSSALKLDDVENDLNEEKLQEIVEMESSESDHEMDTTEIVSKSDLVSTNVLAQDRKIRQLVMKRILQLFKLFESSTLSRLRPFLPDLFNQILNPRISQLSTHFTNSASSSALLEILVCAAVNFSDEDLIEILTNLSPELWHKSVEAFALESTKPLITSQLLNFFEGLLKNHQKNPLILTSIIIPDMDGLLDAFDQKLKSASMAQFPIILRILALVQILSPYVVLPDQAFRLCKTFEGLLKIKWVNEGMRVHLIGSMTELVKISKNPTKSLFEITSSQWNLLKSRPGRESLCKLFDCFAQLIPENNQNVINLADFLRDLNSWLPGKLGEPDFDKRLSAFARLKKDLDLGKFKKDDCLDSLDALVPLTWSMIYFLQDVDELSIRNQSFGVLKSVIKMLESERISGEIDQEFDEETEDICESRVPHNLLPGLIQRILLPSVKVGIKSRIEVIRIEFVSLLDLLISSFPSCFPFSSLNALIRPIKYDETREHDIDLDEENIFRNIYHIQEPRRNRAIRQIGEFAVEGRLTGLTRGIIDDLLLPLILPTTLPDPTGEIEFTVSEAMHKDSIVTCGALMAQLPWKAFIRKLIQFVKDLSENKRSDQWNRTVLRLLPSMISQFKFTNISETSDSDELKEFVDKVNVEVIPAMFRLLHKSESTNPANEMNQKKTMKTATGGPLSSVDKISVKHSLRVPIAISIGQMIKLVSNGSLDASVVVSHLPRLLTELLTVLKQKDAETRDVARGALVKIMGIFGTAYFPFLLKEARTLLNRGYQRHVLTFTAHAILVEFLRLKKQNIQEDNSSWNLDASADLLVDLALASSFGFQAAERATIEWSGKQPEVRAAKGPEIIALTAQFTSQSVLEKCLIFKITQLCLLELDESTSGANKRGTGALDEKSENIDRIEGDSMDLLLRAIFLNGLYPLLARDNQRLPFLLSCMHEILNQPCDSGSRSHLYRLQSRAFEFVSHVLNNFKEDGAVSDLMSILIPFIDLTRVYILERGKHLVAITSAITLFNQFIAYKSLHPYITDLQGLLQKLFSIILKGNSGTPEGASSLSAAFKLTSTLIRDWPDLEVTDSQIKTLIEYTRLQLENQHQQSLTFSLIRSLISRQIVLLQLFELMETVRHVMITSHQASIRQQCRSVYVHFLTNYPMATKKLEEQLDFLLANIRYEFATGRESCIEVIMSLVGKLPDEIIENVSEAWFLGLTVQLAKEYCSDGSEVVASSILQTLTAIFAKLPLGKRRDNLELLLIRWITQSPKFSVQAASWRIVMPLIKEITNNSREILLYKGIELISDESTPEDLLLIILQVLIVAIKADLCSEKVFEIILKKLSESRFFKGDCDFSIRHSIALLWNSILNQEN